MKKLLIASAVAVALVGIAATANGQSGSTIQLVQRDRHFAFIDVAPKKGFGNPSQGDEFVIDGALSKAGRSAGSNSVICTVTRPGKKAVADCNGTLILAGGTISINGVSRQTSNGDTFAVTGGTGSYTAASGVVVTADGKGNTENISVELR